MLSLFQCMSDTWTTRLSVKAHLNCAACGVNTVYLFVCVRTPADDLLMTNGWNELEELSMGSQPCEVKCKIDI